MLIKEANRDSINEMIKKAEGRAKERTITYYTILEAIRQIEARLNISKTAMEGITADIDWHAQNFPRAYKWTANSTQVFLKRKKSGWDLVSVERDRTRRASQTIRLNLTETAREAILEANTIFSKQ